MDPKTRQNKILSIQKIHFVLKHKKHKQVWIYLNEQLLTADKFTAYEKKLH